MKILIAEDDMVSRRRLEANLRNWSYEVVVARDGDEAWQALQGEDAPRLAVLDWMMPGMDGIKLCEQVRKLKGEPYIYILMLTVRDRKEDVVTGLDAGADDYLTKPYDAQELKARLRTGRRILALQEALLSARDALRFQVTLDPLTGLWNRTAILATLKRERARAEYQNSSLTVFKADLDHFNRINETYGHLAGDSVLRDVSKRIQSVHRPFDTVGRYRGEEFIIICPGYRATEAAEQAERLRAAISDVALDLAEGFVQLTVSVGAVTVENVKEADPNLLLEAAEMALSRAKALGGNCVQAASPVEIQEMVLANPRGLEPRPQMRMEGRLSAGELQSQ